MILENVQFLKALMLLISSIHILLVLMEETLLRVSRFRAVQVLSWNNE